MTVRIYGKSTFNIAVIHGGPGGPGYMAPVARELSKDHGVLEPLQSKDSLQGQIEELKEQISLYTNKPIILIGSSWGAILALIFAAQYKNSVKKLILIGSGTFDKTSAKKIKEIRFSRLSKEDQKRAKELLNPSTSSNKNSLKELFELFFDADTYEPITRDLEIVDYQHDVLKKVWEDYKKLRDEKDYLKNLFSTVKIPVTLIHGEHDPHPIKEVYEFLKSTMPQTKLYELKKCGHYPWIEKYAKGKFYEILKKEIMTKKLS